jgi:hypothetical protein
LCSSAASRATLKQHVSALLPRRLNHQRRHAGIVWKITLTTMALEEDFILKTHPCCFMSWFGVRSMWKLRTSFLQVETHATSQINKGVPVEYFNDIQWLSLGTVTNQLQRMWDQSKTHCANDEHEHHRVQRRNPLEIVDFAMFWLCLKSGTPPPPMFRPFETGGFHQFPTFSNCFPLIFPRLPQIYPISPQHLKGTWAQILARGTWKPKRPRCPWG